MSSSCFCECFCDCSDANSFALVKFQTELFLFLLLCMQSYRPVESLWVVLHSTAIGLFVVVVITFIWICIKRRYGQFLVLVVDYT